jgi:hypothetical protein
MELAEKQYRRDQDSLSTAQRELEGARKDAERWKWWLDHFNSELIGDEFLCFITLPTQERDNVGLAIDALKNTARNAGEGEK